MLAYRCRAPPPRPGRDLSGEPYNRTPHRCGRRRQGSENSGPSAHRRSNRGDMATGCVTPKVPLLLAD